MCTLGAGQHAAGPDIGGATLATGEGPGTWRSERTVADSAVDDAIREALTWQHCTHILEGRVARREI